MVAYSATTVRQPYRPETFGCLATGMIDLQFQHTHSFNLSTIEEIRLGLAPLTGQ